MQNVHQAAEEYIRSKYGQPENFHVQAIYSAEGYPDGTLVARGAVYDGKYTKGPRQGEPRWTRRLTPLTDYYFSVEDITASGSV